jgi:BMFP domain-containing protein YqiC
MKSRLVQLWRLTVGPIYYRLFRRYFDATIGRLDAINARIDELDVHVHNALAARWEMEAIARRVAMLEDSLNVNPANGSTQPGSLPADQR